MSTCAGELFGVKGQIMWVGRNRGVGEKQGGEGGFGFRNEGIVGGRIAK